MSRFAAKAAAYAFAFALVLAPAPGFVLAPALGPAPAAAAAAFEAKLLPPWDGQKVPAGQQCRLQGGKGKTPPMQISNMPKGTVWILVEYNDESYPPLATNGGHGKIGYPVSGRDATLPAVPGMTDKLPLGVRVVARARSSGDYASRGYLPPCSGGRGNLYSAEVMALGKDNRVLAKTRVRLGRY